MAKLTGEQRRIAQQIIQIGRKRGATPMEIKAAIETGLVESGLRNLNYGDADSKGWRQERQSLYPNPTNVTASINRFYDETKAARGKHRNAGDLAAAVQRPAAQYRGRYAQRSAEADAIMRALGFPQPRGRGQNAPAGESNTSAPATIAPDPAVRQQLLLGYLQNRGRPDALLGLATGLKSLEQAAPTESYGDHGHDMPQRPSGTPAPEGGKAGYQRGKPGKIIGTPHAGTHTLGNWQSDNALDISMPNGTVLTAPRDAVVEKVGGSYKGGASRFDGYQVTLRLSDGNRIFMTHLSKTHVKPGQKIRAGQAVGRSGSANGVPHLHVGVERGDPKRYF